jgi:hypothetical protein
MATYCSDADLVKIRPNILQLGVVDWEAQREEAYAIINRVITARWYRPAAPSMGIDPNVTAFNPEYLTDGLFLRLEVYKTLELAYLHLMKGGQDEDGFERQMKIFRNRYNEELALILDIGIDYDWSGSGDLDDDEKYIRAPRRLKRS